MDSDAVFHEESEYVIVFKIRATNNQLSPIFRKKCYLFFAKNEKKVEKVFYLYFYKNRFALGKFYCQNDQRKNLYKPWKFQWIRTWPPNWHGKIPWIYPVSIGLITCERIEIKVSAFHRFVARQLAVLIHSSKV